MRRFLSTASEAVAAAPAIARVQPLRSVLYVPGSNAKALAKAAALPADGVILDLEDAVAPSAKADARDAVKAAVESGVFTKQFVAVRINGVDTPWYSEDVKMVARLPAAGVHALVLPKVDSSAVFQTVWNDLPQLLNDTEAGAHGSRILTPSLKLWAMIETPAGVLNAADIAQAGQQPPAEVAGCSLSALVAGTSDLTKDLRARHTRSREPLLHSLSQIVLVARAFGLTALDGVHLGGLGLAPGSPEAAAAAAEYASLCTQGRDLGFDGKTVIHPSQVAPANAAFGPTAEEVAFANRVIAAHAEAEAKGLGVVVVDGKLIENLHVEEARRVLGLAAGIAALA